MWVTVEISDHRFLFAVLRKNLFCRRGCRAWCSFCALRIRGSRAELEGPRRSTVPECLSRFVEGAASWQRVAPPRGIAVCARRLERVLPNSRHCNLAGCFASLFFKGSGSVSRKTHDDLHFACLRLSFICVWCRVASKALRSHGMLCRCHHP